MLVKIEDILFWAFLMLGLLLGLIAITMRGKPRDDPAARRRDLSDEFTSHVPARSPTRAEGPAVATVYDGRPWWLRALSVVRANGEWPAWWCVLVGAAIVVTVVYAFAKTNPWG